MSTGPAEPGAAGGALHDPSEPPSGTGPRRIANYFPRPFPDELIYSVIARFARNSGITENVGSVSSILFGQQGLVPVVLLPRRLEHLASLLPEELGISAEDLLIHHTLYNYSFAFETAQRRADAREVMMASAPGTKPMRIGQMMPPLERLRYCPSCNSESLNDGAIQDVYWHRKHQLSGIDICMIHGRALMNSDVRIGSPLSSVNYHAATPKNCPTDAANRLCNVESDLIVEQMQIAKFAGPILAGTDATSLSRLGGTNYAERLDTIHALPGFGVPRMRGIRSEILRSVIARWPRMLARHPHLIDNTIWISDILIGRRTRNSVILHAMVDLWLFDPTPTPANGVSSARSSNPEVRGGGRSMEIDDHQTAALVRKAAESIRRRYPAERITRSSLVREADVPRLIRDRGLTKMTETLQAISHSLETTEQFLTRAGAAECTRMQAEGLPVLHSNLAKRLRLPRNRITNRILRDVVTKFHGPKKQAERPAIGEYAS